ncbi:MAG: hypothetical protein QM811_04875 [Pirellulales bacterium]
MEIEYLCRYLDDARLAYRFCVDRLGISAESSDFLDLLRAGRNGQVAKVGTVVDDFNGYKYHIHGIGYSFKDLSGGKQIHFEIVLMDGRAYIRISVWALHQYVSSIGKRISMDEVNNKLKSFHESERRLTRIQDGGFELYCWLLDSLP